jgi:hypothetical protein
MGNQIDSDFELAVKTVKKFSKNYHRQNNFFLETICLFPVWVLLKKMEKVTALFRKLLYGLELNPPIAEGFSFSVNLCYSSPEMYYLFSRNASTFDLSKSSKIKLK